MYSTDLAEIVHQLIYTVCMTIRSDHFFTHWNEVTMKDIRSTDTTSRAVLVVQSKVVITSLQTVHAHTNIIRQYSHCLYIIYIRCVLHVYIYITLG